jgi:hypothetical protein
MLAFYVIGTREEAVPLVHPRRDGALPHMSQRSHGVPRGSEVESRPLQFRQLRRTPAATHRSAYRNIFEFNTIASAAEH